MPISNVDVFYDIYLPKLTLPIKGMRSLAQGKESSRNTKGKDNGRVRNISLLLGSLFLLNLLGGPNNA